MSEVINDLLGYEGLKIIQRTDMLNFSLDSTLLADFVVISKKTKKIMDLGTGNAPIPLFLSLRTDKQITGVEIQKDVFELARRSVNINNLNNQISIINEDIKGLHKKFGNGEYDLITCNPPFFKYTKSSNINKNDYLTIARHEVLITLEEIIIEAKRLLSSGGIIAMVHRVDRLSEIISILNKHKFEIKRIRFVHPKKDSDANMILFEAKNNGNQGLKILPPLVVHSENGEYSEEVLKIFNFGKR